jgi:hypothetical protein
MKLHSLLVVGLAAGIVGCAEKEQAVPGQGSEMEPATPAVTEAPAVEPEASAAQTKDWRTSAFMDHMHVHAEQLDDLNFALADGDLEAAMMPAYWLSRHKSVGGLPSELQQFVIRMRQEARAVEEADDLVAAGAAAQQISAQCQGCHAAVGVVAE